eukprot:2995683-Pleurochrysis_carterae.AAC.1
MRRATQKHFATIWHCAHPVQHGTNCPVLACAILLNALHTGTRNVATLLLRALQNALRTRQHCDHHLAQAVPVRTRAYCSELASASCQCVAQPCVYGTCIVQGSGSQSGGHHGR